MDVGTDAGADSAGLDMDYGTSVEAATAPPGPVTAPAAGSATFDQLVRQVRPTGLMDLRPGYYVVKTATNLLLYAAGWAAFAVVGDSWWQLAVAVFLAFCFGQTSFVAHDAGHRQVFRTRKATDTMGILHGNLLIGTSFGWWINHHGRHHSFPNHLELDPDILRRQVIFTPAQRASRPGRASGFVIRHQSWLFFVLIMLEGMRLHLAGYVAARKGVLTRNRRLELTLVTGHLVAYLAAVFYVMSPLKGIAFIVVHQALFGLYEGMIFAPNHKGLPVRDGEENLDWLRRQVVTSRNIGRSRFTDFMYGGLNYQIEHHLFPTMPRANLRRVQPIVKEFCLANGVSYAETGVASSYREISRFLGDVSDRTAALETVPPAPRSGD